MYLRILFAISVIGLSIGGSCDPDPPAPPPPIASAGSLFQESTSRDAVFVQSTAVCMQSFSETVFWRLNDSGNIGQRIREWEAQILVVANQATAGSQLFSGKRWGMVNGERYPMPCNNKQPVLIRSVRSNDAGLLPVCLGIKIPDPPKTCPTFNTYDEIDDVLVIVRVTRAGGKMIYHGGYWGTHGGQLRDVWRINEMCFSFRPFQTPAEAQQKWDMYEKVWIEQQDCRQSQRTMRSAAVLSTCSCKTFTDVDGDQVNDSCDDACPADPYKSSPGICGCGQLDIDTDSDGILDCNDQCPRGFCGFWGDADGDGDVDMDDFGALQQCIGIDTPACRIWNLSGAAAPADIERFISCSQGSSLPGLCQP